MGAASVSAAAPHISIPSPTRPLSVAWARVDFGRRGAKVRPVVILSVVGSRIRVLTQTSQDRHGRPGYVRLQPESVATFDKKCRPGWINCREAVELSVVDICFPDRPLGQLTSADTGLVLTRAAEWILCGPGQAD